MTSTGTKLKRRPVAKPEPWKGKAPRGDAGRGQWKSDAETSPDEKIGFAVVSVKLRPAEKAEFQALCKDLGISPNWVRRSMVRQAAGFLEVDGAALDALEIETSSVVAHLDPTVGHDVDLDDRAVAGHRLVDRVVDHLVHQVVQAARRGVADVHTRPFAHVLQVGEVLEVALAVLFVDFRHLVYCCCDPLIVTKRGTWIYG